MIIVALWFNLVAHISRRGQLVAYHTAKRGIAKTSRSLKKARQCGTRAGVLVWACVEMPTSQAEKARKEPPVTKRVMRGQREREVEKAQHNWHNDSGLGGLPPADDGSMGSGGD